MYKTPSRNMGGRRTRRKTSHPRYAGKSKRSYRGPTTSSKYRKTIRRKK